MKDEGKKRYAMPHTIQEMPCLALWRLPNFHSNVDALIALPQSKLSYEAKEKGPVAKVYDYCINLFFGQPVAFALPKGCTNAAAEIPHVIS